MDAIKNYLMPPPPPPPPSPPPPPPPKKTVKPWRETDGWGPDIRRDLKLEVAALAPQISGPLDVPFFRIMLVGEVSSGKSSFFNSVNSIYHERVDTSKAQAGTKAGSFTKKYREYEIKQDPKEDPLPWRICDTMGLEKKLKHDKANILRTVDGHVPDGFQFSEDEIFCETQNYTSSTELKDKAHCVALVIKAVTASHMDADVKQKLKDLREHFITRDIPVYVLLTHIDKACTEINEDVTNVYHSIAIRDLVTKVKLMLHGLPESQIFPIMNYSAQIKLNNNMDILLLTALRHMLYSAQSHLENNMEQSNRLKKSDEKKDLSDAS